MDLVGALLAQPLSAPSGPLRLWRTSHTGGHRFAPTAIVLPSATLWAWADRDLLQQVVSRTATFRQAMVRYRGFACLGPPASQALERAVMAEVGWPLSDGWRRAETVGEGRARLETQHFGAWEATVREGRRVPQPDCRTDPAMATKFGTELIVEDLRRVA